MRSAETDAIVNDYFRRLETALANVPTAEREALLADIRTHVDEARAGLAVESEVAIRELLDHVGRPEDIAAEAVADGAAPRRAPSRRGLIGVAVVVAVAVIAVVLAVVLSDSSRAAPHLAVAPAVAPTVNVGGFPTGVALDAATDTIYVASGNASALTMINARTCNASDDAGCTATSSVATAGHDAIGVVVDEQTHTVYAVNGSGSVAVINARTCNALDTSGCAATPALVNVAGGPEFLALDQKTNTIYVADTSAGTVAVIDGRTCDATDTRGCATTPATVTVGEGAFPIAVDETTNTIYVGTLARGSSGEVYVIDGNRCDAADTSGCAARPATVSVGAGPSGIAIDPVTHSVYVSSESGTVSVVNGATCDATDTTGCATQAAVETIGSDPRGDAFDPASDTLYATNAGSDTVSLINAATCHALDVSGCGASATAVPVGTSPRRIVIDAATHTAYVVNTLGNTVSMLDTQDCNATDTRGCPTASGAQAATTGPLGSTGLAGLGGASASTCTPSTVASTSGVPAVALTSRATQVANGWVDGEGWSLWSAYGQTGADGIEDGGLVVGGLAYGLCPGFPNPAEFELVDAGTTGIAYGVIGYPGKATVRLSTGTPESFTPGTSLPPPDVRVVNGVSFFIDALPRSACAYPALELDATAAVGAAHHELGFGSCTPDQIVPITSGMGEWNSGGGLTARPGAIGSGGARAILRPGTGQITSIPGQLGVVPGLSQAPPVLVAGPSPTEAECAQTWNAGLSHPTLAWLSTHHPVAASVGAGMGFSMRVSRSGTRTSSSGPTCVVRISLAAGEMLVARGAWSHGRVPVWTGDLFTSTPGVRDIIGRDSHFAVSADGRVHAH